VQGPVWFRYPFETNGWAISSGAAKTIRRLCGKQCLNLRVTGDNAFCHGPQRAGPSLIGRYAAMTGKVRTLMNAYEMGLGWIWMITILVLVGPAIAALVQYLRK
jgi:hypothetical protein